MSNERSQSLTWLRWLVVILLLLVAIAFIGWTFASREAGRRVIDQLVKLDLGRVESGGTTVTTSGVTARDIKFFRDGDSKPWLKIGKLAIQEPLGELVAGGADYDQITLSDTEIRLDAADLSANQDDDANAPAWDLAAIVLPAEKISLKNTSLRMTQADRDDLLIDNIDADLQTVERGDGRAIDITASIHSWLEGDWKITGELRPESNQGEITVIAQQFQLPENWQRLPGLPDDFQKYLGAAGTAAARVELKLEAGQPLDYRAVVTAKDIDLNLPAFELDLKVEGGQAVIADGKVDFRKIVGTGDGVEKIIVDAQMNVGSFPVQVDFEANFQQLSVATIRKLVPDIPDNVQCRSTGKANGGVTVTQQLETSLQLKANGKNQTARYGSIDAGQSAVDVNVAALELGSDMQLRDLQGSVNVTASPRQQSADDLFTTFKLDELQQQLKLAADVDAEVQLEIPLATAANLDTWQLEITAAAEQATLDGRPLNNIRSRVRLDHGNLVFDELTATVPNEVALTDTGVVLADSQISIGIDWPLTDTANHPQQGQLKVVARRLPADWALAVGQSQIQRANGPSPTTTERNNHSRLRRADSKPWVDPAIVEGQINFDANLEIDAANPDDVQRWNLQAAIVDSLVSTEIDQLSDLSANVKLAAGELRIESLTGQLKSGSRVEGSTTMQIMTGEFLTASLRSGDVPLAWLLDLAKTVRPDVRQSLASAGIVTAGDNKNVAGRVEVDVELGTDDVNPDGWKFRFTGKSKKLVVNQQALHDVELSGNVNDRQVQLESLSAMPVSAGGAQQGSLKADGHWDYIQQQGEGAITWRRTPIRWLAKLAGVGGLPLLGTTSGKLDLGSVSPDPPESANIPFQLKGEVSVNRLGLGDRLRSSFQFQLETRDNAVHVTHFQPGRKADTFEMQASLSLKAPHEFSGSMDFNALKLSTLNASIDPAEQSLLASELLAQDELEIAGAATGKLAFAGQVQPLVWQTDGAVAILEPSIGGQMLSDIDAQWNVDNRDFTTSKVSLAVLGGEIKLVDSAVNPQRIRASITGLRAAELTALAGPGFPILAGDLSGEASINQWDVIEESWADLKLTGASSEVVGVRLSDLGAKVDYRQQNLKYEISGRTLAGTINGKGATIIDAADPGQTKFPLEIVLDQAELQRLAAESNRYRSLKPLGGALSTRLRLDYEPQNGFVGKGRVLLNSLAWDNKLLTRAASANVRIAGGMAELDNFRADLRRGEISGRAKIPLVGVVNTPTAGTFQLDIRQFDLERLLEVALKDPPDARGFFDARLSGRIGRVISGRGTVGFDRATVYGVATDSLKVPVQFRFDPLQLSGRVEVRQSTVRVLHGRVNGEASLDFGRRTNVDVDLNLSKLDTSALFAAFDPRGGQGQGQLSGQLVLRGQGMTRSRDLKGSFKGSLDRAQAFRLPLLSDIANVIGGGQLNSSDFNSDKIDLRLSNNKIEINNLKLNSSLAEVAIGGDAYLDGRLDLSVAAQVDSFNQPTGLDRLVGISNPLAAVPLGPLGQTTEFLSGRSVFAKVNGTIAKPIVRLDASQQLRSEATRYFLRGSQILPNANSPNE